MSKSAFGSEAQSRREASPNDENTKFKTGLRNLFVARAASPLSSAKNTGEPPVPLIFPRHATSIRYGHLRVFEI
ncbi:MAG TPA: hypothetical protein VFC78_09880 [Tepidisphaeraceae bacterium]|nr:hypothetical protein [Tepidisphaeraceae bacterium]